MNANRYNYFLMLSIIAGLSACTQISVISQSQLGTAWVDSAAEFWGVHWHILPNPMHGSWSRFIAPEDS